MVEKLKNALVTAKAIQQDINSKLGPPEEGFYSQTQQVLPFSVVRGSRGYIEKVVNQINGCYEKGWYDGCAVMIRRLVETLIIEVYEKHGISSNIQNSSGDFFYLRDLIDHCLRESTWNLSRNCKQALPRLKDVGDKSAHSRRFNAHYRDIQGLVGDLRVVTQELIYLAGLK